MLIEQFTRKTPAAFLQERIFDPLGMTDTGYNVSEENENRIAGLHTVGQDGKLTYMPPWGP